MKEIPLERDSKIFVFEISSDFESEIGNDSWNFWTTLLEQTFWKFFGGRMDGKLSKLDLTIKSNEQTVFRISNLQTRNFVASLLKFQMDF